MHDIFGQITATLERLSAILADEAERLKVRNIEGLDSLLADKLAALQAAELADGRRRELLVSAGYPGDAAGMRHYLAAQGDQLLNARWEAILGLLQQVQILNEGNGRIIHRGLSQIEQMLDLLRGNDSQSAAVYGPTGQTTRSGGKTLSRV
jgi:flagellar biosynthesis/type III secretory pathway chaperone